MKRKRYGLRILLALAALFALGFLLPQRMHMPVAGATRASYDQHSFWAYPWGESVTHKGVDIFARRGTAVRPATPGFVLRAGTNRLGGKVVYILGPKWRVHYYAHLDSVYARPFSFVGTDDVIGTVGSSGNAKGKPPHLHYTLSTLVPYPWRKDAARQGARKMFYLDPIPYLNEAVK
ncbi:MAG: M23 family metallopeptidase [Chitinophagaceae bacterium]|nr:MAG: M23 family metallopeptidase [Chitinophagaceae bacterium]